MNFSIALPAMVPQSTGHPASLPANPAMPDSTRKVTPTRDSDMSVRTDSRQAGSRDPQESAPPSAMQIKIMEILEQQARELEEEAANRLRGATASAPRRPA
jgi:hypothetical protein